MNEAMDRLAAGKYISLTTYKRNGSGVATPVWVTREGDRLYVITDPDSGKVKRLRNSPRVTLAPCDMRGTVQGPAVEGEAVLLDEAGSARVSQLVNRKYGLMARAFGAMELARRLAGKLPGVPAGSRGRIGIEISVGSS